MNKSTNPLILLVDDSETILEYLKSFLTENNYDVITASNGFDAINLTYGEYPDLILLDVIMPHMDGYQVCRFLKHDEKTKDIPIVILTSKDKPIDKFWGKQTGADLYVLKNTPTEALLVIVDDIIKRTNSLKRRDNHSNIKEKNLTVFDLLSKVNSLLDKKLYETVIINRINEISKIISDYRITTQSILKILMEIINFDYGCLILSDKIEADVFLYNIKSHTKVETDKIISLVFNYISEINKEELHDIEISKIFPENEIDSLDSSNSFNDENKTFYYIVKSPQNIMSIFWFYGDNVKYIRDKERNNLINMIEYSFNVLQNSFLFERLKYMSITDELTKLYNRRYFFQQFEIEFYRSQRYGSIFSIILIDVDNFKKVNDNYGHITGDIVLKSIAKILKENSRASDIVARYGGEEFIMLLPETDILQSVKFSERIRKTIEEKRIQHDGNNLSVTISIGISSYNDFESDKQSIDEILSNADKALYKAKNNGKNQVVIYDREEINDN